MPDKIFISYRRQDTAANALGICQYLEQAFGRKNVFIDVDMRAGAKFPAVLEQRLAECKVMLVLIGPNWLNSLDEKGQRRLESSDDWVRLEIAHALKRNITVIPVRVNGAELPDRAALPDDVKGLLDHQAASVTNAGFRHEMSGLAHDLRAIATPRPWRRFGIIAAGVLLLLLIVLGLAQAYGFSHALERMRLVLFPQASKTTKQNGIWNSSPGEWVLYEVGNQRFAHYFKLSSVTTFGDRTIYLARIALETDKSHSQAAYEDDRDVVDCKRSIWAVAERTLYNQSGDVLSHFKFGEPESLDLGPLQSGTVVSTAAHILCSEQLRTPLLSKEQIISLLREKIANTNFSYLSPTPNGDGELMYGQKKPISNSAYQFESSFVTRFFEDQPFAALFPGKTILGLPPGYRARADRVQLDCAGKKAQFPETNYFDSETNLAYLGAPNAAPPLDIKEGTPLAQLLSIACGAPAPGIRGTYEGMNDATYKKGGQGEQKNLNHRGAEWKRREYQLPNCGRRTREGYRHARGYRGESNFDAEYSTGLSRFVRGFT
jgi:hypothetical protein